MVMREIRAAWGDLPHWFISWFCEQHGDGLHRYITDRGLHWTKKDKGTFLAGCCDYTRSLGFDTWVEGHKLWLRLDLDDAHWTWLALKA